MLRHVTAIFLVIAFVFVDADEAEARRRRGEAVGFYSDGSLWRGVPLTEDGRDHYLLYPQACYDREPMVEAYPDEGRRGNYHANPRVIRGILKVVRSLRRKHPDAPRVPVGELSNKTGGKIPFHRSHQNGLDVDVFFLLRPRMDTPAGGPWKDAEKTVPLCHDGPELEVQDPKTGRWRVHGAFAHDWNWTLVSKFAAQEEVKVLFIGALLKRELARWSRRKSVPAKQRRRTLDKLKAVVCRHGHPDSRRGYRGNYCPHADHIHVRYHCPADSPDCR